MYTAHFGPDLVARTRTKWGIRRAAKKWLKSRENRYRRPRWGNLTFRYDNKIIRLKK